MELQLIISEEDVKKIQKIIEKQTPFIEERISKNINRKNIILNKNSIIKTILMCLLTTQQKSGKDSNISKFLNQKDFNVIEENLGQGVDVEGFIKGVLQLNNLPRFTNRIPQFFAENFKIIQSDWLKIEGYMKKLEGEPTQKIEREIADKLDDTFKGLGPKQARNFLQSLGLTKYEIPIDSRVMKWLKENFSFPLPLSPKALQDKFYYHFALDAIQKLCSEAKIYPCLLDAAIFSSFD